MSQPQFKLEDVAQWVAEGRDVICAPDAMDLLREKMPEVAKCCRVDQCVAPGQVYGVDWKALHNAAVGTGEPLRKLSPPRIIQCQECGHILTFEPTQSDIAAEIEYPCQCGEIYKLKSILPEEHEFAIERVIR